MNFHSTANKTFIKFAAALLISTFGVMNVFAAALTSLSDTMSSVKINANSNHDFSFVTPTGVASGQTIIITFPSGFTINAALTFTDVDVLNNGAQVTLAAAPSGATAGVARTSATVLTYTNGTAAIAAGNTVRIKIGTNATNQSTGVYNVQNDSSTGQKSIGITGTFTDTGTSTVTLINDDTVQVSATVQQSITFSISSNSINFGTLGSGAAKYASSTNAGGDTADTVAHNLAVSTNAPSGYAITLLGPTLTSLQNASNTITAIGASPATSAAGTEQFGIYATKSGGVGGTIATPYATASSFGFNATATSSATFASGSSSTNTETYALHYIANIAGLTEAGTYTTGLVYVATANF